MKKTLFILAAIIMACSLSKVYAGWGVPSGNSAQALASSDYGGFPVSTGSFNTEYTTACFGSGVYDGVIFSSGTPADYVDVYDSSCTLTVSNNKSIGRWYNVAKSTDGSLGSFSAGWVGANRPLRFKKGLIWKASTAIYNLITVPYNKDQ